MIHHKQLHFFNIFDVSDMCDNCFCDRDGGGGWDIFIMLSMENNYTKLYGVDGTLLYVYNKSIAMLHFNCIRYQL